MKLLIATDNYPPRYDGISRFLQEIIPSLKESHDVSVIAPDFGPTSIACACAARRTDACVHGGPTARRCAKVECSGGSSGT